MYPHFISVEHITV